MMLDCNVGNEQTMACRLKLDWEETEKGRPVESAPKIIHNITWSTSCVYDMIDDLLEFKVHCISAQKTPTFLFGCDLQISFTFCFNDGLVNEVVNEPWSCAPTCKFLTIPCPEEVFENGLEGFCYTIAFTNVRFCDLNLIRGPSSTFLKVEDHKPGVHISKLILSKDLPYFQKLFAESNEETYDLQDVKIHPFVVILHELYNLHINTKHMHPVILQQAFVLAKRFGAESLLLRWKAELQSATLEKRKPFVETLDAVGFGNFARNIVKSMNRVDLLKLRKRIHVFQPLTAREINQRWDKLNSMKNATPIHQNPHREGPPGPSSSSSSSNAL